MDVMNMNMKEASLNILKMQMMTKDKQGKMEIDCMRLKES